jgi:hypothetical protein
LCWPPCSSSIKSGAPRCTDSPQCNESAANPLIFWAALAFNFGRRFPIIFLTIASSGAGQFHNEPSLMTVILMDRIVPALIALSANQKHAPLC